ncbi:WD repeat-containing protein 26-like [Tropilaelaps mercedesae]|uniref:WD repeat-containing protein 26-like n=1 Tax=Tropilaelaps mercedesae TaxID=418985 RepID=A0A1V9X7U2_9ACAR|nr:WD repeat-containing protein 26-like [Tropilaelaps mercedesae]
MQHNGNTSGPVHPRPPALTPSANGHVGPGPASAAATNGNVAGPMNGQGPSSNGNAAPGELDPPSLSPLDPRNPRSAIERDIIKLIGQHLRSLGLHRAVTTLADESGCSYDHPLAVKLQNHVMNGQLDLAIADLIELEPLLLGSNAIKKMRFLLLEEKFLEFLAQNKTMDALACLRTQLSPLKHNIERVHQLSSFLMMSPDNPELLLYRMNLTEARDILMERLQKFLPASVMLPPRRLRSLLAKAQAYQVERCELHNKVSHTVGGSVASSGADDNSRDPQLLEGISLLSDHACDRTDFPCHTTQILTDHSDEIWVCAWSHDGLRLATGSKDSYVIIWQMNPETRVLSRQMSLEGHTFGVSCIAWSPDDSVLLVCGYEDSSDLWIWNTISGDLRCKMNHSADDSLTTCAWQASGTKFVCGGTRGQFYQCDVTGQVLDHWEGVRLHGLQCLSDGRTVLAADSHHRIKSYNFDYMHDEHIVAEDHSIMSFTVDKSDRFALLNLAQQGLHLWDIRDKTLLMKYRGITQGYYTIHSCFGGVNEKFIASGSEDNKVYIFNRWKETPIATLEGHIRTVNCVSWNPRYPNMLASVSDDSTVRIWGPVDSSRQNSSSSHMSGQIVDGVSGTRDGSPRADGDSSHAGEPAGQGDRTHEIVAFV